VKRRESHVLAGINTADKNITPLSELEVNCVHVWSGIVLISEVGTALAQAEKGELSIFVHYISYV
jgi:hypothetical protein